MVPEEYPFDTKKIFESRNYFWLKYYLSQRTFFALAKQPTYANYEALLNALNTRVIDCSKADIWELKNTEMTKNELEKLLYAQNEFSHENFMKRALQMDNLRELELKIIE